MCGLPLPMIGQDLLQFHNISYLQVSFPFPGKVLFDLYLKDINYYSLYGGYSVD